MYKAIPEIRVSSSTDNISENELLSDIATDCEILETPSTPLLKAIKHDEELLTDVEGSDDEDSHIATTTVHPSYPIESLNRVFDIGRNCEEITNFKEPSKLLKTITLDKLKLNESHQDGGYRTDIENFDDSDVDIKEYEYDCNISNDYLQTSNFTSIVDNFTVEKISPVHTPVPDSEDQILTILSKPLDCFTDTEMLLTDNENTTSMKKCSTTNKSFRYLSDSCTSDSDENMQNKEKNKNIRKKSSGIRGNEVKLSANKESTLLQTKQQDNATDIETIGIDNIRLKGIKRNPSKRQTISQRSQINSSGNKVNMCQQMKSWKHCTDKKWQKIQFPTGGHNCNRHNLKTTLPEIGHLTDIEAFDGESEGEFDFDDVKPVSYIPESKSDLVLTSESDQGGVSLIMPIRNTSSLKYLQTSSNNETGGHTDTEDLPDFEETYPKLCPTPDLQLDNTIVTNVEHMIEKSKLKIKLDIQDPHTDTEELDLQKNEASFNRLNIKDRKSPQLKVKECLTDVEDLSDMETQYHQLESAELIERSGTDIDTLSDMEGDDDYCTPITPEIKPINSFIAAKEGIGLFPTETKQKLIEITSDIRTLSPSPTVNDTDSEELLASMDEEQQLSNEKYSTDEDNLETHMSVVHIKHTRKFPIEGTESLHIKDCDNQPDPLTDVEEIVVPLDDRANKKRNLPEDSSVSFNKSSEGISCIWYSERRYSCDRREERSTSGEKISHHKPVDVTKIQKGEEEQQEMASGCSDQKSGSGKSSSQEKKK